MSSTYFFYFAYGSNLLEERMKLSNPHSTFHCVATLPGHSLGFYGFGETWKGAAAAIFPLENAKVYGVVWKVDVRHTDSLNRQESGYNRVTTTVQLADGSELQVVTYRMKLDVVAVNQSKPSPHYHHVIVTGAERFQLPPEYVDWLRSFEHNGYSGRVKYDLEVLKAFHSGSD